MCEPLNERPSAVISECLSLVQPRCKEAAVCCSRVAKSLGATEQATMHVVGEWVILIAHAMGACQHIKAARGLLDEEVAG